jgi:hypothetical protein
VKPNHGQQQFEWQCDQLLEWKLSWWLSKVPRLNPLLVVVDVRDTFGLNVPTDDRVNVCESEGAVALRSEPEPVVPVGVVRERVPVLRPVIDREAAREPEGRLLDDARLLEADVPVGETARVEVMSERRRGPVDREAVEVEIDRLDVAGLIRPELEAAIGEVEGAGLVERQGEMDLVLPALVWVAGEVEGLIDPRGDVVLREFGCGLADRVCGAAGCMVPARGPCVAFDRGAGLVKVLGCADCEGEVKLLCCGDCDCDGALKLLGWEEDCDGAEKVRPEPEGP